MERLLINSWELCPKETRAAVLKAITDAFGCEPSVDILANSTDDDLSGLIQILKGLGIAHTSLFRTALAEARKSLAPRGEFSASRGEFSREDGGGTADGQRPPRQAAGRSHSRSLSARKPSMTPTRPRSSTRWKSG